MDCAHVAARISAHLVAADGAEHDPGVYSSGAHISATHNPGAHGDHDLNPSMQPDHPLTAAAVLIPVIDRPGGATVLLTRRTDHLNHHAGQVSFPGGRLEPGDADHVAAALRETEEEIGLTPDRIEVIASLNVYVTRTGFEVVPVIGIVTPPFTLRPNPAEVAEAFEVPLAFLVEVSNYKRHHRYYRGVRREFYAIPYNDHYIWGATAGMLVNLSKILRQA